MRKTATALLLLGLATTQPHAQEPAPAPPQNQMHLSLRQGQIMAAHALKSGNPDLTLQLSQSLLEANPKDHLSWRLQAAAYARTGQADEARKSAARAFRFAPDKASRYQMAQLASRLAYQGGNPGLAQYWLRRTAIYAPDEKAKKLIAKDYGVLRRINPWSFRVTSSLKPSSNVNNGSDAASQEIDGLASLENKIGPRGIALPGIISTLDTVVSRRLRQNANSSTSLTGRLYVKRVSLSSSAKSKAAQATIGTGETVPQNSEFASTYGEITLGHTFKAGETGSAYVAATGGTSWYGGNRDYNLAKLTAARSWTLSQQNRVTITGSAEHRLNTRLKSLDADVLSLGATLDHRFANGSTLSFSLGLRDTQTKTATSDSTSATLQVNYAPGRKFGPATLTTGLIFGTENAPNQLFFNGTSTVPIPGGRKDKSAYADLNVFFEDYDYAGFAPMLRLRAGKRFSNHSRYESSEISFSLGVVSKF